MFKLNFIILDKLNEVSTAVTLQHNETSNDELSVSFTTKSSNKCDIDTNSSNNGNENNENTLDTSKTTSPTQLSSSSSKKSSPKTLLNKELEEWIWEDNRYFLQDRNIFEHTYFK